jgi:hypothetical protein
LCPIAGYEEAVMAAVARVMEDHYAYLLYHDDFAVVPAGSS